MRQMKLVCIDAPHFSGGAVDYDGQIVCAAPVIKYMVGWRTDKVEAYCTRKKWSVTYSSMTRVETPNGKSAWELG